MRRPPRLATAVAARIGSICSPRTAIDLGRCRLCGLLYVGNRPSTAQRLEELDQGILARGGAATRPEASFAARRSAGGATERLVALAQKLAPPGRWLDIGCGTGTLLRVAEEHGIAIDGIELTPARRDAARQRTSPRSMSSRWRICTCRMHPMRRSSW